MSDFKEYSGWVSTGFMTLIGAIGYLYKDYTGKKQKDVSLMEKQQTVYSGIIAELEKERDVMAKQISEMKKMNSDLLELHAKDLEAIKESAVALQKLSIELTKEKNK